MGLSPGTTEPSRTSSSSIAWFSVTNSESSIKSSSFCRAIVAWTGVRPEFTAIRAPPLGSSPRNSSISSNAFEFSFSTSSIFNGFRRDRRTTHSPCTMTAAMSTAPHTRIKIFMSTSAPRARLIVGLTYGHFCRLFYVHRDQPGHPRFVHGHAQKVIRHFHR